MEPFTLSDTAPMWFTELIDTAREAAGDAPFGAVVQVPLPTYTIMAVSVGRNVLLPHDRPGGGFYMDTGGRICVQGWRFEPVTQELEQARAQIDDLETEVVQLLRDDFPL